MKNELIGLTNFKEEVKNTCNHSYLYNDCAGFIPSSLIVQLDKHNGRTSAIQYMAEKYLKANVIDFYSGVENYISLNFSGSLAQAESELKKITQAADYRNKYCGLIEVDIIALAQHPSTAQFLFNHFFDNFDGVAVFFVPENMSSSETRFVEQMVSNMERIKQIPHNKYSSEDFLKILKIQMVDKGVVLSKDVCDDDLLRIITTANVKNLSELSKIIKLLLLYSDFSNDNPVITESSIKNAVHIVSKEINNEEIS